MPIDHTPAPWCVRKGENRWTGSVHYNVETVNKLPEHPWSTRLVAWLAGGLGDFLPSRKLEDYRTDPQIEADAYLMAASPEMYAALQAVVSDPGLLDIIAAVGEGDPPFMSLVKAAITKAESRP